MTQVPQPNVQQVYVDKDGRLTIEGQKLLQLMAQRINNHENRIATLEP